MPLTMKNLLMLTVAQKSFAFDQLPILVFVQLIQFLKTVLSVHHQAKALFVRWVFMKLETVGQRGQDGSDDNTDCFESWHLARMSEELTVEGLIIGL